MKAGILDANVLLRFLLQDNPKQSAAATALFKKAEQGEVELQLPDVIVAEVTFVLEKVYRRTRIQIANALLDFMQNPGIKLQSSSILNDALLRYRNHPVDFPDALLVAISVGKKVNVVSFDRDFDRFPDVTRYEPKS